MQDVTGRFTPGETYTVGFKLITSPTDRNEWTTRAEADTTFTVPVPQYYYETMQGMRVLACRIKDSHNFSLAWQQWFSARTTRVTLDWIQREWVECGN